MSHKKTGLGKKTRRLDGRFSRLLLTTTATLLPCSLAAAATTTNYAEPGKAETLVVTAQANENPTAPLKGFVAKKSTSGTKTATELVKTPQSVSVVTRDQMDVQDVSSVSQALRYTPGVFTEYRGNSNRYDELFIRGFSYAPRFLDGLSYGNTAASQNGSVEPWLLERVEVVRGPASVLYGQVSPGGLINMISKRPTTENIRKIQFKTGDDHLAQAALDLGGKLNDEGTLFYRLNAIGRTKNSQVKDVKEQRFAIAPSITYQPNSDTSFTLLTSFQRDPKAGYRNFLPASGTVFNTAQGKIPRDFNVSDPNYNESWREQKSIGYLFEHIINDVFTVRQNVRYSDIEQRYRYLVFGNLVQENTTLLNRFAQVEWRKTQEMTVDNQLGAQFNTGGLEHNVLAGLDYKWNKDKQTLNRNRTSSPIDWTSPQYGLSFDESTFNPLTNQRQMLDQIGVYLQDQMEWNNWNLLLSGRQDWAEVRTYNHLTSSQDQQNDHKLTGRAGLLYAFDNGISPYISASTSFEPVLQRNTNSSRSFDPTTGRQYEVGVKYQPRDSETMMSVALYDLQQTNLLTRENSLVDYKQIGKVGSRGVETELRSKLTDELSVIATYSYTDAKTKRTEVAGTEGKKLARVPAHLASLWGNYEFQSGRLAGLSAGVGARYVGSSYGDTKNSFKVPSVNLYDAMLGYDLGKAAPQLKGASIQVNVNNLFDKDYVASCASTTSCFYGIGRTTTLTVNYSW
ncbi:MULTISPECIES: TonB-dependent siderophore receptor [unclassified Brenneria]|uniref:TonB-dependent siderophore receptor n=1 Tax=unclassified Brenneria TaxID=2634434 RepID=UPI0029C1936D|nr:MULTISPECIES: TonB-dependent siderophore receptor [unclassified Brenneria]MDX5630040.1 TonB-dependent siderophore receptor [Brenneria sp. L3-3Z]MDX5697186.1 TonB-dependent siderophore receptor [Brenneria sp. L4-2C]